MSKSLKIVATPIGNLRDITLRAIDEIKKAQVIFAEDTRHSLKLISGLGIELSNNCRLISCSSQNESERIKVAVQRIKRGDSVVLLSDAGCPTISDPGSLIAQGVIDAGYDIEIIPGASALSASLMGAGIDTTRFAFLGFLPQRTIKREKLIKNSAFSELSLVIFESPLRVKKLLDELYKLLGERRVVVARELTKLHETFHRGILGQELTPPIINKGECVIIVEKIASLKPNDDLQNIDKFIADELQKNRRTKDILKDLIDNFSIKKNEAYSMILKLKNTID